jgi:pimeloyl-ACP methyl ester carboxylesterase
MGPATRRQPGWKRLGVALGCAAVLLMPLGYAGVSLIAAHLLTRSSNAPPRLDPRLVGADAQRWRVRTSDGLTLRGWYFPDGDGRHLVVCLHGMQMDWAEMAGVGRDLHRRGYAVLLFSLRGHGQSDPARLSMGRRERRDVRAVLDWARREGYSPDRIGWIGNSMGAATLLLEGARNRDIRAAVLDSPFGDLPELLDRQLTLHSGLPRAFNPGILFAAHHAFGIRTDDLRPVRVAPAWRDRPLLLIHGEADSIVPVRHTKLIARAAGPKARAVTVPGVEHVAAYWHDPEGYVSAVHRFFRRNLAP